MTKTEEQKAVKKHPVIQFKTLGHINIIVSDVEKATAFYEEVLGATPIQNFPHFRNIGFAKSAGFMEKPEEVDVTIRFLVLPTPEQLVIELMEYHSPKGKNLPIPYQTNDFGGVRHIALRVSNIEESFAYLKTRSDVRMISPSLEYKPFRIDHMQPREFHFYDEALESDPNEKQKVCDIIGSIKYFYFIDPCGVQWELEQGHDDMGSVQH